ncbi:hypothetical protein Bbelb_050120 [Branchiostoma belcheri]|nr:hypothetical protein Bbelb_050120 [Branchiostoma belcheri]
MSTHEELKTCNLCDKTYKGPRQLMRQLYTTFLWNDYPDLVEEADILSRVIHRPRFPSMFGWNLDVEHPYLNVSTTLLDVISCSPGKAVSTTLLDAINDPAALLMKNYEYGGALLQVIHGLSYLHQVGILHNDLKSDNVMIRKVGEKLAAKKPADHLAHPTGHPAQGAGVRTHRPRVHPEYPWLHATPDFVCSCECCGQGCGEVKCPYCLKDIDFIRSAVPARLRCRSAVPARLRCLSAVPARLQCRNAVPARLRCRRAVPARLRCRRRVEDAAPYRTANGRGMGVAEDVAGAGVQTDNNTPRTPKLTAVPEVRDRNKKKRDAVSEGRADKPYNMTILGSAPLQAEGRLCQDGRGGWEEGVVPGGYLHGTVLLAGGPGERLADCGELGPAGSPWKQKNGYSAASPNTMDEPIFFTTPTAISCLASSVHDHAIKCPGALAMKDPP